ncbi:isopentenyl-diphosphate Delta-isomerase [Parvicella tangerina]|uniref:Isopentenyl-diphosphate delta-isomerase n=1 Tax=Parvicella tangerina TaxID=2829795 RepID=A0A916NEE7_9FLAO|nr:isopentenyl-diphosphate Delta-isomerase [Parvicella tangerina]CAG5076249.1 Isopentenyl-diphosphate Delta-isomerase [Parvicella tangerina]
MSEEYVILVDENDQEVGQMEKMEAHEKALLHRAFSVFVFDKSGKFLLQRRALEKYHSGGLWTNACCSHPRAGETTKEAAMRRLNEELGFTVDVEEQFSFIYKSELDKGLTEHEFDHVFFATYEGEMNPNPAEVMEVKYVELEELKRDMKDSPENYTEWFKICFNEVLENL